MTDTAAAAAPAVKAGDLIQIRQFEGVSTATQNATRQAFNCDATPEHWSYAQALEPLPDGSARVAVNHRGNRQHGQMLIVKAGEFRTQADVAALATEQERINGLKPSRPGTRAAKHLANQLKKFEAANGAASAKQADKK